MNVQGLIGEVAKRHNVLVDPQDPVFVAVTLNELLLEECLRRVSAAAEQGERRAIAASERQLALAKQAAGELVSRTATYVTDQVRAAAVEASSDFEHRISSAAASVHTSAKAAARHRNVTLLFMLGSMVATALALSTGASACSSRGSLDRTAEPVHQPGGRTPESSPRSGTAEHQASSSTIKYAPARVQSWRRAE